MIDRVRATIEREQMTFGQTVTVALSGGADSVCLLHLLNRLKDEYGFLLTAAHLNHGLRGEEADADESFCRALCEEWGIPFVSAKLDVMALRRNGESVETAARRLRYDFLYQAAEGTVALAHTADDQLETVLFRLCRGASTKGLSGIPPKRDRIVRPLIDCTREQIECYCAEQNLSFVTDSTNADDTYTRNYLRHQVVPLLKAVNERTVIHAAETAGMLRADEEYLSEKAEAAFSLCRKGEGLDGTAVSHLHEAIASRVVKRWWEENAPAPSNDTVSALISLCRKGEGNYQGEGGFRVTAGKGFLSWYRDPAKPFCVTLPESGEAWVGSYRIQTMSREDWEEKNVHNLLLYHAADYDKMKGVIEVRSRREGDFLRLAGRGCTKSLKKLFNEAAVSPEERNTIALLADEEGVVLVPGLAVAERAAVTAETKRVIAVLYEGIKV